MTSMLARIAMYCLRVVIVPGSPSGAPPRVPRAGADARCPTVPVVAVVRVKDIRRHRHCQVHSGHAVLLCISAVWKAEWSVGEETAYLLIMVMGTLAPVSSLACWKMDGEYVTGDNFLREKGVMVGTRSIMDEIKGDACFWMA
mmetsp:Transcript_16280/g.35422  ORF Transcript_16280/g.35422 Transcript_16280/m.35422 type:complete len:143 (+) Transcript_16280:3-431(+)